MGVTDTTNTHRCYMIDKETRARIAKLPAWIRSLIKRLENGPQNLAMEVAHLRTENGIQMERIAKLRDANDALIELFRRAGDGGSDYAKTVIEVLEYYEIFEAQP